MTCLRVVLASGLIAVGLALAAAPASAIVPQEFEVDVNPLGNMTQGISPQCATQADGAMHCTIDTDSVVWGESSTGTVKNTRLNLSGDISMTCDASFKLLLVFTIGSSGVSAENVDGKVAVSCAWLMDFGSSSSMTGTMQGGGTMSPSGTDAMQIDMSFTVNVAAGTGDFADQVGSGSWTEHETESLSRPPSSGPPGAASMTRVLATAAAKSKDGSLSLKLHEGRPQVEIVDLSTKQTKDKGRVLRAAVVPGASCKATATSGSRSKALGQASDSDKKGQVHFSSIALNKLSSGNWKIKIGCGYHSAGKTLNMAPGAAKLKVT